MSRDGGISKRDVVKGIATVGALGTTGLAGCVGGTGGDGEDGGDSTPTPDEGGGMTTSESSDGGGELSLTIGGVMSPPGSQWEGEQPSGHWEFEKRVEERTDGRIQVENVAEGQLCGELTCPDKVAQGAVEIGSASIGNSSKFYPMNDIWMLPFTFPSPQALGHVHQKPETWENYWVPFAQEYGVVPLWMHAPTLRSINIGLDRSNKKDADHRLPKHTEGMDCRRTASQVSGKALNAWGMNPVSVSWADSLQGLRTGVVGGMEAAISPICAYEGNMAAACGESVHNQWTIHNDVKWASVEWLKSLSEENLKVIAEESRGIYRDLVRRNGRLHKEVLGVHTDDPPEDSCVVEHDLQVNYVTDDEQQQWKDMVSYEKNPDMYSDIVASADKIGVDGEAFHEYLKESARESAVFSDWEGYSMDAWWDDYLQEM